MLHFLTVSYSEQSPTSVNPTPNFLLQAHIFQVLSHTFFLRRLQFPMLCCAPLCSEQKTQLVELQVCLLRVVFGWRVLAHGTFKPVLLEEFLLDLKTLRCVLGEGNGTPLQYSCLENPMDGGAW